MARFTDKIAVITGGNSGIGLATAQSLVAEGAQVVLFGRNQTTLDEAVSKLGERATAVQGDVSSSADLERLFAITKDRFGKIDILFANAGVAPLAPIEQVDEAFFDQVFDVNVKGLYFTVQKAAPLLSDGASVILTGSVASGMGMPGFSVYGPSKAAVRALARSFSAELVARNIRVNLVTPGPIETPIYDRMGLSEQEADEMGSAIVEQVPLKRWGTASEVADAVLFLAGPESSYVVGTELVIDGGMTQV